MERQTKDQADDTNVLLNEPARISKLQVGIGKKSPRTGAECAAAEHKCSTLVALARLRLCSLIMFGLIPLLCHLLQCFIFCQTH